MSNVAESLVQAQQLIDLYTRRMSVLAVLEEIDSEIDATNDRLFAQENSLCSEIAASRQAFLAVKMKLR